MRLIAVLLAVVDSWWLHDEGRWLVLRVAWAASIQQLLSHQLLEGKWALCVLMDFLHVLV